MNFVVSSFVFVVFPKVVKLSYNNQKFSISYKLNYE